MKKTTTPKPKLKSMKSMLSGKQEGLSGFYETTSSSDADNSDDEYGFFSSAALPSSAAQPGFMSPGSAAQPGFMSPGSAAQPGFMSPGSAAQPGFMSPGSAAQPGFMSPGSAAQPGFMSPGSAANSGFMSPNPLACSHGFRLGTCSQCKKQGVIPKSARMFEPPIPKSAGLSFSPLEVSEVNPVNKNLFGTKAFYSSGESDEGEMREGGGRRKYRKSSKKSKRKSSKKSKKKSSRKARKLTRR